MNLNLKTIILGIVLILGVGFLFIPHADVYPVRCGLSNGARRVRAGEEELGPIILSTSIEDMLSEFRDNSQIVKDKIVEWVEELRSEHIRIQDIQDLIDIIPKLAMVSGYNIDNFSTILDTLKFLPASAVEGLLEFSKDYNEFIDNLRTSKDWIERFRSGRIYWTYVSEASRRVFVEIAAWEHGIESYKIDIQALRGGINSEGFQAFGGKGLHCLYTQYNDIWSLKEDLRILPKNFEEWVELIKISRINWDYVPIDIQKGLYEKACEEINGDEWFQTPSEERYKLLYFMQAEDLKKHFDFLDGKTLSSLIFHYSKSIEGDGQLGSGGFMLLRRKLGVPPQTTEQWIELLKIGRIWWCEMPINIRWEIIKIAAKERGKEDNPILLTGRDLFAPFVFLDGRNLEGLVVHYSRNKVNPLKVYLIIPMLTEEYLVKFRSRERMQWINMPREVKRRFVEILARHLGKKPLSLKIVDFGCETVPEFGGRNIRGLLSSYEWSTALLVNDLFPDEVNAFFNPTTRQDWLERIRIEAPIWSETPVEVIRIYVEELAKFLGKDIGDLKSGDFYKEVPSLGRALVGLLYLQYDSIYSLLREIGVF